MSIRHFIQEVEKGLRAPVYLLYADGPYLLREASQIVAANIPEAEKSFSFNSFDLEGLDEKVPLEHMLDAANTLPFMGGGRRIVVIANIQELAKKDSGKLEAYIANPSPSSRLILLHTGALKGQFKDIANKVKAIPLDVRPQDIPLWIRENAREKGMDLTSEAIEYLIGVTGGDIGLISSELEKFTVLGNKSIGLEDIRGLINFNGDYDAFDLVNGLKEHNAEKVFRIARVLLESQEPYTLIGAINWHYGQMASREKGRDAAHYQRVFEILNDADIGIKTSGGSYPFEYLLIRLLRT